MYAVPTEYAESFFEFNELRAPHGHWELPPIRLSPPGPVECFLDPFLIALEV